MQYELEFKPRSIKDLKKLSEKDMRSVVEKIEAMSYDLSGDVKHLTNFTPEYRLRVGDYRVLFEKTESTLIIYRIVHRREAY